MTSCYHYIEKEGNNTVTNADKLCPLFSIGSPNGPVPCKEKNCAWWYNEFPDIEGTIKCAVVGIADNIDNMRRGI